MTVTFLDVITYTHTVVPGVTLCQGTKLHVNSCGSFATVSQMW